MAFSGRRWRKVTIYCVADIINDATYCKYSVFSHLLKLSDFAIARFVVLNPEKRGTGLKETGLERTRIGICDDVQERTI